MRARTTRRTTLILLVFTTERILKGSQGDRSSSRSSSPVLSWTTTIHNTSGSNNNIRESSFSNNIQIQRQFFNSRTNPLQFAKGGGKGKASTSSETNDEKKEVHRITKKEMSLTHCTGANYFKPAKTQTFTGRGISGLVVGASGRS